MMQTERIVLRRILLGSVVLATLNAGCHPDRGTIAVRGRVRFDGGPPPAACAVIFAPLSVDGRTRPGSANCAADGSFWAGSYRMGDGLLPGRYRAVVRCLRDFGDENRQAQSHVPAEFVPPEFEVPADPAQPLQLDIDITTARGQ